MPARPLERSSAARAGWIFLAIFGGWLAFVFVPAPAPKIEPALQTADRASKLKKAGLSDNPDLDGLPELFAVWADKADWVDGRTTFAFWNPGARDFTYFFVAVRSSGKVRFHAIARPVGYDANREADAPQPDEYPLLLIHPRHLPTVPTIPPGVEQGGTLTTVDPAGDNSPDVPHRVPVLKIEPEHPKIEVKRIDLPHK